MMISFVILSLVGIVSGFFPALKASRVLPLAALREVSVERTRASAPRVVIGLALTILGVIAVLSAPGASSGTVLARSGLGAALTLMGVVVLGPAVLCAMIAVCFAFALVLLAAAEYD